MDGSVQAETDQHEQVGGGYRQMRGDASQATVEHPTGRPSGRATGSVRFEHLPLLIHRRHRPARKLIVPLPQRECRGMQRNQRFDDELLAASLPAAAVPPLATSSAVPVAIQNASLARFTSTRAVPAATGLGTPSALRRRMSVAS